MDTQQKSNQEILDFTSFIKKYCDYYRFDEKNQKVIKNLGLWATRNPKFNDPEFGWHIDRGILLIGPVGAGKDELFRLLRKYLSYLRSPYGYDFKVVWEYAAPFSNKDIGFAAFNGEKAYINRYYEELCLTDDTGNPTREMVQHFGNKVLIGQELINIRSKVFKESACQSHFSTNESDERLEKIYGDRSYSRLREMCNFMVLESSIDRRGRESPMFLRNMNAPAAPAPRETTIDEHRENKEMLEADYRQFCKDGTVSPTVALNYNLLVMYGVVVVEDEEMRDIMQMAEEAYSEPITERGNSTSQKLANKKHAIWNTARGTAVKIFYNRMREKGCKSIFGEREVNIPTKLQ